MLFMNSLLDSPVELNERHPTAAKWQDAYRGRNLVSRTIWKHCSYWFQNHKLLRSLHHGRKWTRRRPTETYTKWEILLCSHCNPVQARWLHWFVRIWCSHWVPLPGRCWEAGVCLLWANKDEPTTRWGKLVDMHLQLLRYFRCKSELDENVNVSLNSKQPLASDPVSLFGVFSLVLEKES